MKVVDIESLKYDEYRRYTLDGHLFTGVAVEYYPEGGLRSEVPIFEGRHHGIVREWYPDGQMESEDSYHRGGLSGTCKLWHRNGRLAQEGIYERGICLERKQWDPQGYLVDEYRLLPNPNDFNYVFLQAMRETDRRAEQEGWGK